MPYFKASQVHIGSCVSHMAGEGTEAQKAILPLIVPIFKKGQSISLDCSKDSVRSYVCVNWLAEYLLQGCAQQMAFSFIFTVALLLLSGALEQPLPLHIQALSSTAMRP